MQKENFISIQQNIRWLPADMDTPISLYMKIVGNGNGFLLESAEVDGRWGRFSILGCDIAFYISCHNGFFHMDIIDERFKQLSQFEDMPFIEGLRKLMANLEIKPPREADFLPPITRAIYGFLGYEMAALFNPVLQKTISISDADCILALPATILVFDHLYNRLCQLSLGDHKSLTNSEIPDYAINIDEENITSFPDEKGYKEYVRNICELLRNGEAIQVVPSVRFCAPFKGNPFTLYRRMRRYNASPYMFYMHYPDLVLFGSSPEVMVSCDHDNLKLSPIAGTRKRGKSDSEDYELVQDLLHDPKERAEHVMLVDLGRNDLGKIAQPDSVRVERYMEVEKFSHVMHLTSKITAKLDKSSNNLDALDVLAATFPAGTVSGAPKIRAMQIINSLEAFPRGPYAGCIGWIGLDKDSINLDMGITIRSMWVKNGRVCWQAGGGIVHDSSPDLEWKEVCNKSAIMRLAIKSEDAEYVPSNR